MTPSPGALVLSGKVRGVWNQTVDEFGDVDGPNVLRLAAPSGSVVIAFNTTNSVKAHPGARERLLPARPAACMPARVPTRGHDRERNDRPDDQPMPETRSRASC